MTHDISMEDFEEIKLILNIIKEIICKFDKDVMKIKKVKMRLLNSG